jgi:hypothetical protein
MSNAKTNAVLLGVGALVLLWSRRQPVGTVTTSEGYDLTPYGGPASYPEPVKAFALAIARAEGFYVRDSVPARAHNPGDLKVPGKPTLPGTSISQFANDNEGWQALYKQLWLIVTSKSAVYDLGMSIDDMAHAWTATQQTEWASNVALYSGADRSTPLWQVLT